MVHYLSDYVILFFAYATLGWCMETLYMGVRERRITNRGFLLGPCCPIYGAGMVGITLLFQDSHYSYWHVFFSIILLCGLLEYAVSALMERVFHTRWWDYHDMRFNIHGRICLETIFALWSAGDICPLPDQSVSDDVVSSPSRIYFREIGGGTGGSAAGGSDHLRLCPAESFPAGRRRRPYRRDLTPCVGRSEKAAWLNKLNKTFCAFRCVLAGCTFFVCVR